GTVMASRALLAVAGDAKALLVASRALLALDRSDETVAALAEEHRVVRGRSDAVAVEAIALRVAKRADVAVSRSGSMAEASLLAVRLDPSGAVMGRRSDVGPELSMARLAVALHPSFAVAIAAAFRVVTWHRFARVAVAGRAGDPGTLVRLVRRVEIEDRSALAPEGDLRIVALDRDLERKRLSTLRLAVADVADGPGRHPGAVAFARAVA